jgi:hypothetical protein
MPKTWSIPDLWYLLKFRDLTPKVQWSKISIMYSMIKNLINLPLYKHIFSYATCTDTYIHIYFSNFVKVIKRQHTAIIHYYFHYLTVFRVWVFVIAVSGYLPCATISYFLNKHVNFDYLCLCHLIRWVCKRYITCICVCVYDSRVWTQGLGLVRQVLYHLSHTPSPF